jgi:S-adenosylmethionine:tRNA ribosyltransferase-isomerase
MHNPYSLSSYQYELPEELIAQYPCEPRDSSRLMVIKRATAEIDEIPFRSLIDFLQPRDGLVFNDTRVVPARLIGKRATGGKAEVFLTRRHSDGSWNALVRPGRKMPIGTVIEFNAGFYCQVIEVFANGERRVRFHCQGDLDQLIENSGQIPLPLYIRRMPTEKDRTWYQTVFAAQPGALAAPTAGLHFSDEMLRALEFKGVSLMKLTLHTGLGTFRPVQTEDIRVHGMHAERYIITTETATQLNVSHQEGHLQICVGTTCCRALESAAARSEGIHAGEFETNLFIYPGYQFKYVKSLLTNFHLPGTSLLMLVCAFAGRDLIMEAYAKAIKERYRFFSYGDAMLIL